MGLLSGLESLLGIGASSTPAPPEDTLFVDTQPTQLPNAADGTPGAQVWAWAGHTNANGTFLRMEPAAYLVVNGQPTTGVNQSPGGLTPGHTYQLGQPGNVVGQDLGPVKSASGPSGKASVVPAPAENALYVDGNGKQWLGHLNTDGSFSTVEPVFKPTSASVTLGHAYRLGTPLPDGTVTVAADLGPTGPTTLYVDGNGKQWLGFVSGSNFSTTQAVFMTVGIPLTPGHAYSISAVAPDGSFGVETDLGAMSPTTGSPAAPPAAAPLATAKTSSGPGDDPAMTWLIGGGVAAAVALVAIAVIQKMREHEDAGG